MKHFFNLRSRLDNTWMCMTKKLETQLCKFDLRIIIFMLIDI